MDCAFGPRNLSIGVALFSFSAQSSLNLLELRLKKRDSTQSVVAQRNRNFLASRRFVWNTCFLSRTPFFTQTHWKIPNYNNMSLFDDFLLENAQPQKRYHSTNDAARTSADYWCVLWATRNCRILMTPPTPCCALRPAAASRDLDSDRVTSALHISSVCFVKMRLNVTNLTSTADDQ